MATFDTQSNELEPNASPASDAPSALRFSASNWMGAASVLCAGIAGLGLLLVVFGVLLTPSDLLILIGAGTVVLAAAGWVIVAVLMTGSIIKRWFNGAGAATSRASSPAKPE